MTNIEPLQSKEFAIEEIMGPTANIMHKEDDAWLDVIKEKFPDKILLIIPATKDKYIVSALIEPEKDIITLKEIFNKAVMVCGTEANFKPFEESYIYDPSAGLIGISDYRTEYTELKPNTNTF